MSLLKKRITAYLSEKGLNIAQLSSKIGTPYSVLFNIADGKVEEPSIKTLIKLADEFNCTIDELLGRNISQFALSSTKYNHKLFKSVLNYCAYFINDKLIEDLSNEDDINENQILFIINEIYTYCNTEGYKTVNQDFANMMLNNLFKIN